MTKRQGEGQKGEDLATSTGRRGPDSLGLATLAGVVAVLVISFSSWRDVERVERSLDERLGKLETRLDQVADRIERAPAPAAQRGPDPNRVYTIQTARAPARGPAGAPVTIAEFSDFQCPFCSKVGPTLSQIEEVYGDKVRIVWKHLPLDMHKNAMGAHLAAVAPHPANRRLPRDAAPRDASSDDQHVDGGLRRLPHSVLRPPRRGRSSLQFCPRSPRRQCRKM